MRTLILALSLSVSTMGQISFGPPATIPAAAGPGAAAVADLNLDALPDVIVTVASPDRVDVTYNSGIGLAATVSTLLGASTRPFAVATGDVDGDGDTELVVTLRDSDEIQTIDNLGGVFLVPGATNPCGTEPTDLALEDLDGDGDLDVVTSNRASGDLTVLRNSGAGAFAPAATLAVGGDLRDVVAIDLDGDGDRDLAVAEGSTGLIATFVNDGSGNFSPGTAVALLTAFAPEGFVVTDLDGDGLVDIAVTSAGTAVERVFVYFGTAMGTYVLGGMTPLSGFAPSALCAGDFDGDGDPDLAVTMRFSNSVEVLENDGAGGLSAGVPLTVGTEPTRILCADVDGGLPDLVVTNSVSNDVSILGNLTPPPGAAYPGTGEDLFTVYSANAMGFVLVDAGTDALDVAPGTVLTIAHASMGGTFTGVGDALVFGSVLPTGAVFPTVAPGLHVDLPSAFAVVSAGILGFPSTVPTSYTIPYPGGAAGFSVLIQCVVSTATAVNMIYASTTGFELRFL